MKLAHFIIMAGLSTTAGHNYALELTSKDLDPSKPLGNDHVLNNFGCSGKNISPELQWSKAPKGTQGFAVTVYDPDAPTGSGWWHWVVFNIPKDVNKIPTNAGDIKSKLMPDSAIQSRTDFGTYGYGGACPPKGHGKHRYQFKVFALDVDNLPLNKGSSAALVGYYLHQHTLESDMIEVTYGQD